MGVVKILDSRPLRRMLLFHPIIMIDVVGCSVVQRLMGSMLVVELNPDIDSSLRFPCILECMQVHTFVFQRSPETFHHRVVAPAPLPSMLIVMP